MGISDNFTVYLCGPINGCTDEQAKDWREKVKLSLPSTLDPMRRDYRGREDQNLDKIVELDKIDIAQSDALLVNYDKPSVGTSMEILYAWERGKLVVIVAKEGERLSPWLRYHSHAIFSSFDGAITFIKEYGGSLC